MASKTALWRLQISNFFLGGMPPDPPSGCGQWPHLLWPDEYKLGDCAPADHIYSLSDLMSLSQVYVAG